jgi:hypothetical protein
VIPISQPQIIHNIFGLKTAVVNKFCLLSFGKIRSTENFCREATNENRPPFQRRESKPKNASPDGTKENVFQFLRSFFCRPCGAWKFLRLNPAVKTAGYFQIVPFGTKSRSTEKF